MSGRSRIAALGVAVALTAAPLRQEVREIVLKPADATLAEPFTSILSIRELADGRVLISDNSAETRLVSADLRTQRVRLVGQIGGGPGEYRRAGGLFALPHDSTFFIDAPDRERRWLLLHADSIVVTLPPDFPAFRITGSLLHGVDWGGRLLGVRQAGGERLSQDVTRDRWIAVLVIGAARTQIPSVACAARSSASPSTARASDPRGC